MYIKFFVALGSFASLIFSSTALATFINILNPGFENPVVGNISQSITGWNITGSGAGVWNINITPSSPLCSPCWTVASPEGNQTAWVAPGPLPSGPASIYQILSDTLQANTMYNLSGKVGHPIGFGATPNPDTIFTIEFIAGNNLLSSMSGTGPEGSFTIFQLSYNSFGSSFLGQSLQIRLKSNQTSSGFDDIRLDATPITVPEPSTITLIIIGGLGMLILRKQLIA